MGGRRLLPRRRPRRPAQILRPGDVPLSVRAHPYGPCARLHHRRRHRPPQTRLRFRRAAPDGVGRLRDARRERRHGRGRAPGGMDLEQHRRHAPPAQVDGPVLRLAARGRDLFARLLPPRTGDVPRHVRKGHGLPRRGAGELGPGGPHRARQRTGHRRQGLALRRAGREAQPAAMDVPHHRLRRRPPRLAGAHGALAGLGARHAGELDRAFRRRGGALPPGGPRRPSRSLHHPARHAFRREFLRPVARPPSGGGMRRGRPGARRLHRRVPPLGHLGSGAGESREARL